ncbi:ChaN family lipoprotein [Primorskyibacter aestuariivivens]|uniref:ChaN family lipoprotein n=1 Tax=Primorskyibacter aestuariivivens TaxID=1888912 RepID=UPI0023000AD7|nr:ChaN family lipoprotein [Primorskyibacter aestuariivivens]MDA7429301.1 ChaN family lipoprotein [Primorskyibacter aestuariivivens]
MRYVIAFLVMLSPWPVWAAGSFDADVVILGELHDNPGHHARQAALIREIAPRAVVFEMLTPDEAAMLDGVARDPEVMAGAAQDVAWFNMSDYAGVLVASPRILGAALPHEQVRQAFSNGAAAVFGEEADAYGLTEALSPEELEARKALQFAAHCEAMPMEMMGGMVEAQRLRDASFARSVLAVLDRYGAPVVLITGNGHARKDWGVPVYLARVQPGIAVFALGQGEPDQPPHGSFDQMATSDAPERDDPCATFR